MQHFLRTLTAEMYKQHRIYFHDPLVYFSMIVWPFLEVLTAYYLFMPFVGGESSTSALQQQFGTRSLEIFLLTGYLGYNFFMNLIQSAWHFSFERYDGTLECIFLTPANRFAVVLGNAMSSLFENTWLLTVFCGAFYFLLSTSLTSTNILFFLLGLVIMVLAAIAWGTFLNCLFLITRDTSLFFTILQEPLNFFGGVRLPITLFPMWMKIISYCIPLTYCLNILREATMQTINIAAFMWQIVGIVTLSLMMFLASYRLLDVAERQAKRTGSFTFY